MDEDTRVALEFGKTVIRAFSDAKTVGAEDALTEEELEALPNAYYIAVAFAVGEAIGRITDALEASDD